MSDNPETCSNYLRIIRMLVDLGTKTARDIFYHLKPRDRVSTFFASTTIGNEIFHLKRKHVITLEQYNKIMSDPNPDEFDLSLLVTLLSNIFVGMIDPPLTGWDKTVDKHDLSLGADLLRLKELRNTLVGHSLEAKITSEEFEKLWGQVEQVLLRLNQHIDVTHVNDMKISLKEYKSSRLDPENEDERKYVGILQRWYEEGALTLSRIKDEVDKLWERTKEFECFFEDVPECYSRYAILLYEGGSLVLNAVLRREEGRGVKDLKTLLLENSHTLKGDIPNIEDLLSHDKGKLNLTSWDIPSVCSVILRLFEDRLSFLEKDAIRTIKSARENYADIALASLDGGKFATYWADLKSSLYTLSSGQEEMVQIQCKGLVDRYGKEPLDKNAANKFLGQLGEGSGQLKRLLEAYKETSTRLEEVVEEMDRKGIPFKGDRVMHIKMITRGNTDERREVAEEILFTVWQKALDASDNSEEFPNVKKAVKNILDVIHGMDHVKLMDVTKHCVILTFGWSTSAGLLNLITFFNGHAFKELMTDIDRALTEDNNGDIHVTGYITFESMSLISKQISTDDSEAKYVSLPIVCDSAKGIKNVKKLFDDGHLSNYENQMSQALSQQTGGIISLTTELDLKGLNHLFHTFENSTDDADSNESRPRATAGMGCKLQEPDKEEEDIHTEPKEETRTRNIFQKLERKTDAPTGGAFGNFPEESDLEYSDVSQQEKERRVHYVARRLAAIGEIIMSRRESESSEELEGFRVGSQSRRLTQFKKENGSRDTNEDSQYTGSSSQPQYRSSLERDSNPTNSTRGQTSQPIDIQKSQGSTTVHVHKIEEHFVDAADSITEIFGSLIDPVGSVKCDTVTSQLGRSRPDTSKFKLERLNAPTGGAFGNFPEESDLEYSDVSQQEKERRVHYVARRLAAIGEIIMSRRESESSEELEGFRVGSQSRRLTQFKKENGSRDTNEDSQYTGSSSQPQYRSSLERDSNPTNSNRGQTSQPIDIQKSQGSTTVHVHKIEEHFVDAADSITEIFGSLIDPVGSVKCDTVTSQLGRSRPDTSKFKLERLNAPTGGAFGNFPEESDLEYSDVSQQEKERRVHYVARRLAAIGEIIMSRRESESSEELEGFRVGSQSRRLTQFKKENGSRDTNEDSQYTGSSSQPQYRSSLERDSNPTNSTRGQTSQPIDIQKSQGSTTVHVHKIEEHFVDAADSITEIFGSLIDPVGSVKCDTVTSQLGRSRPDTSKFKLERLNAPTGGAFGNFPEESDLEYSDVSQQEKERRVHYVARRLAAIGEIIMSRRESESSEELEGFRVGSQSRRLTQFKKENGSRDTNEDSQYTGSSSQPQYRSSLERDSNPTNSTRGQTSQPIDIQKSQGSTTVHVHKIEEHFVDAADSITEIFGSLIDPVGSVKCDTVTSQLGRSRPDTSKFKLERLNAPTGGAFGNFPEESDLEYSDVSQQEKERRVHYVARRLAAIGEIIMSRRESESSEELEGFRVGSQSRRLTQFKKENGSRDTNEDSQYTGSSSQPQYRSSLERDSNPTNSNRGQTSQPIDIQKSQGSTTVHVHKIEEHFVDAADSITEIFGSLIDPVGSVKCDTVTSQLGRSRPDTSKFKLERLNAPTGGAFGNFPEESDLEYSDVSQQEKERRVHNVARRLAAIGEIIMSRRESESSEELEGFRVGSQSRRLTQFKKENGSRDTNEDSQYTGSSSQPQYRSSLERDSNPTNSNRGQTSQPIDIQKSQGSTTVHVHKIEEHFVDAADSITEIFGSLIDPVGSVKCDTVTSQLGRSRPDTSKFKLERLNAPTGGAFGNFPEESDLEYSDVSQQEKERRVDNVARRLAAIGEIIMSRRESESSEELEGFRVGSQSRRLTQLELELLTELRRFDDDIDGSLFYRGNGRRFSTSMLSIIKRIICAQDYSTFKQVVQREISNTVGWEQVAWYTYLMKATMDLAGAGKTVGTLVKNHATQYFSSTIRPWIQSRPNGWESIPFLDKQYVFTFGR